MSDTAGHVEDPVSGAVDVPAEEAADRAEAAAERHDAEDQTEGASAPDPDRGEDNQPDLEDDEDDDEDGEEDDEEDGSTQFSMALVTAVNMDLPNQHPTVVLRELERPVGICRSPSASRTGWSSPTPCAAFRPRARSPMS